MLGVAAVVEEDGVVSSEGDLIALFLAVRSSCEREGSVASRRRMSITRDGEQVVQCGVEWWSGVEGVSGGVKEKGSTTDIRALQTKDT